MSDKRFRDRPVDQVHVLPPSVDDYVSDKSRLALFVHDLVRNRLALAVIKGTVRVHPMMRLRLDTGVPRILGKQQKAQETEFRHPEAVAFLHGLTAEEAVQRILLGIDSTGVPIFAREAKAIACFTADIRRPGSLGNRCDVASKIRQPKQIPP